MTLNELIAYGSRDGRVCPKPSAWSAVYNKLPGTRRLGNGWEPPLPLILGAWHVSSNDDKVARFHLHLQHAEAHGALGAIAAYLLKLQESDWHHRGE